MSATNTTTYYEFPVFVGSDKPAWLVDWNGAMNAIDSAIHEAKAEADANASSISSIQSDVTSLAGSVSSQGSSITTLTQSLTSLQGTVNTITSLIGNGEPTTQDKTIIGAINELKADIDAIDPSGQGVEAENVSYDNTDSGLTATNVQDALDEINGKIPQGGSVDAEDVSYDNTTSGLTATDVQSAIDELAQSGSDEWTEETVSVSLTPDTVATVKTFTTIPKEIAVLVEQSAGDVCIEVPLVIPNNPTKSIRAGSFSSDSSHNSLLYIRVDFTPAGELQVRYTKGSSVTFTMSVTKIMYK